MMDRRTVDHTVARELARLKHSEQTTRFGESVFVHVARVADRVAPEARNAALLHEIFELTATTRAELQALGLSRSELAALRLLTHARGDPYVTYVRRIAEAPGDRGRIARMVKLADLDDHLSHRVIPLDAPPYAWARGCLLDCRDFEEGAKITRFGRYGPHRLAHSGDPSQR